MRSIVFAAGMIIGAAVTATAQITTTNSATNIKSTMGAPLATTAAQRQAFESSLTSTGDVQMSNTTPPTIVLTWSSLPNATSFRVLRSGTFNGPYFSLTPAEKYTFNARVLPGHDFYFRVVALDGSGVPLDTTVAYHFSAIRPVTGPHVGFTCTMTPPATVSVTPTSNAFYDDYRVTITDPASRTTYLDRSTSTTIAQGGLPSGSFRVDVDGNLALKDFPVPGQTTRVRVEQAIPQNVTIPVTAAGSCQ